MPRDGRELDRISQERIRILACRRISKGESVSKVMESSGYSRTTYYKWQKEYEKKGEAALKRKTGSGSKPLIARKYHKRIIGWIDGKDPRDYGYASGLWTRAIVSELIEKKLHIKVGVGAVGDLLARMDITPQKPLRRAYERNEEEVLKWKEETYPKVLKMAKKKGSEVFFLDEAGVKSDPNLGKTWGIRGETPIVKTSGQRQHINAISAVNPTGKFWFALYECKFNAEFFIAFLKNFLKYRRKSLILILDGHPSHTAKSVAKFVQSTKGKLQLIFLPPYAPDLNPDEFVWKHLKSNGVRRLPLYKNESLKSRVERDLLKIANDKTKIKSFFKAPSVAYSSV
jgi:transposase